MDIRALAAKDTSVYAGTVYGVYLSTDDGIIFSATSVLYNGKYLFVGGKNGDIYKQRIGSIKINAIQVSASALSIN